MPYLYPKLKRSNREVSLEHVIYTLPQVINLVMILQSTDTCLPPQVTQAVFMSSTNLHCIEMPLPLQQAPPV